ncbi:MAG: transcription-repair coupling factor [Porticoccaceae bacterium]|jgi:transcription-repair coupling factor (superfamily II helicase)|nr:transcription-repair coupling factor [Porticoccaceae bacterium]
MTKNLLFMSIIQQQPASKPGDKQHWGELRAAGRALAVAEAALDYSGLTMLVTETARQAAEQTRALQFFTAEQQLPIYSFPDWETLPYDIFSPHQDIISQRLQTLANLPSARQGIIVVPLSTLMHRIAPTDFVASHSFSYTIGEELDRTQLQDQLGRAGYRRVDTVFEHGEFAFRGSIIDIYPMGEKNPFRIDLLDDEIESLRRFDPESQRTTETVNQLLLLPAREFPTDSEATNRFLNNWHDHFDHDPGQCSIYNDIKDGIAPQGIEYYLPLFFEQTATLFDYLPNDVQLFTHAGIEEAAATFWQDINSRHEEYGVDPERPILPPGEIFVPTEILFQHIKQLARTIISYQQVEERAGQSNLQLHAVPEVAVNAKLTNPLNNLQVFIEGIGADVKILFCAESAGRREVLTELLKGIDIKPTEVDHWQQFVTGDHSYCITTYPIDQGVYCPAQQICLITEGELFGQQVMQRRRRSKASESPDYVFKNLAELKVGSPVVHIEHGVGRYQGLITLEVDRAIQEFLMLSYADDAKLYVPVSSLHLISRFGGGDQVAAPLNRLGTDKWDKAKEKAAKQVRDTAVELLDIYSRRAARKGFACDSNEEDYQKFSSDFAFETTADQQEAIEAVRRDLLSAQPMDRLVCGDVGFGKTEVAMRAAFTAVSSGKQVVVLVPTTLLAHQHLQNFRDRFANWPVRVEELSRFKTNKEQEQVIAATETGNVDILISTHKLLHAQIDFSKLGLMVIDEEHRFGVRQKEKIKSLRSSVDILTMTATPIPRTLNMSMHSIRDLSIIATPPAKRLSVKTFVRKQESRVTREAILREILRGGQVYFLHNDVKSIQRAADELADLVPEARIQIAHGQMRERQLEQVMSDFYHQRFNVLVCTTIIETGIDVPSANTILIERADKFGLAQLHQLRGRVGRSHHQAYAYLMTPQDKKLTADATKRLEAISAADHLGSGFTLATNDLEIRGAGELLGEEQSGHIQAIGFTLYLEMLDRAVNAIRNGAKPDLDAALHQGIEVNMHLPALIPDGYLPDVNMRLTLYKRLSNCQTKEHLHELQVEMIDRFGLLPDEVRALFQLAELRQLGEQLGLKKIEAGPNGGRLQFTENTAVEPMTIVSMVQNNPAIFRLQNNDQLSFTMPMDSAEQRFSEVNKILQQLLTAV